MEFHRGKSPYFDDGEIATLNERAPIFEMLTSDFPARNRMRKIGEHGVVVRGFGLY